MNNRLAVFDVEVANIVVDIDTPEELAFANGWYYLDACDVAFRFADPAVLEKQGELMIVAAHVMRSRLADKNEEAAPAEARAASPTTDKSTTAAGGAQARESELVRADRFNAPAVSESLRALLEPIIDRIEHDDDHPDDCFCESCREGMIENFRDESRD